MAFVAGQADGIARFVAFCVLTIGLALFLRSWRNDPQVNADGTAFATCMLAVGVALPFVLGVVGVLIAFMLIPVAAGGFARHWVRATRRSTAVAAWVCGIAVVPLATWFSGRADERPWEGVLAGLLLVVLLGALVSIRRAETTDEAVNRAEPILRSSTTEQE